MPRSRPRRLPRTGRRRRWLNMRFGKKIRSSTQRKAVTEQVLANRADLSLW